MAWDFPFNNLSLFANLRVNVSLSANMVFRMSSFFRASISTEDCPNSKSCLASWNVPEGRGSLCLYLCLDLQDPLHHFSSCSSLLTSFPVPLIMLDKAVWMEVSGLCRNCFLHLEFPSPHHYLLNSMYSSRSSSITILLCGSPDCDVLETGH